MATEPKVDLFPEHPAHNEDERCPWCDQTITHDKFEEIQSRIEADERRRQLEIRQQMKLEHDQVLEAERKKHSGEVEALKQSSAEALETQTVAFAKREAAAKEQGVKEANAAAAEQIKAANDAKVAAEAKAKALKESEEERFTERLRLELADVREAADKDKEASLQKKDAEAFKEKQRLEKTIADLQRQVAKQTSNELGERAEIDLFDDLQGAFPDDDIKRIPKGEPGADIWQDILVNGEFCGRLIYDSKNRKNYLTKYATKLREDQLAADADHAILATRVFRKGENQLFLDEGVVVAHPARVVALATMLREQVVRIFKANLSQEHRDRKTAELYDYINSEQCHNLFEQVDSVVESILELEVTEQKQHQKIWNKRGDMVKTVQRLVLGQLRNQIDQIIEGEGTPENE